MDNVTSQIGGGSCRGGSFTSIRLMVIKAISESVASRTVTVRMKAGVVSKSRAAASLTVICPELLMAKVVPVIVYDKTSPFGSKAETVCTIVPFGEFSSMDNVTS